MPADDGSKFTAVIMAGSRGATDPVALSFGKSHKCLVDVAGKPMLERVLETVESSPYVGRVVLCVEAALRETDVAAVASRIAAGTLERLDAAGSPAASAVRACDALGESLPLLIVTADHPLLDPDMVDYFCSRARANGDICAGLARAELVLERYPESIRTLLRFADAAYCGCNLFALNTAAARTAAMFWTTLESGRKRPWRLVRMLGVSPLLRYLRRRLSLAQALAVLSRKLHLEARAVEMPYAEAAIDVDKLSDLELVESILKNRESGDVRHV
jgi:GTP:adenosylcobinamide-phosphate guanylyltransferase